MRCFRAANSESGPALQSPPCGPEPSGGGPGLRAPGRAASGEAADSQKPRAQSQSVVSDSLPWTVSRASSGQRPRAKGRLVIGYSLLAIGCFFSSLFPIPSLAQSPTYKVGRTPSAEEIQAWDISAFTGKSIPIIGPEGKELPPGSGSAKEGTKVFGQWCARCHGPDGKYEWPFRVHMPSGGKAPILAGETGAVRTQRQFAPSLWDYIHRAMPLGQGGSLDANETYAVTAYLLYLSGIIKENDVMDAKTLPKVQMPNRPRPRVQ